MRSSIGIKNARLADTFRFISKLTFQKVQNFFALFFSYHYARWSGKPYQKGFPLTISVEPTTSCNLGCPECPSGLKIFSRPTGFMQLDTFKKCIDELKNTLLYTYFYFQGEPYLHPNFHEMVQYAAAQNIYTVTSTNGHFLTKRKALETVKSGLDRILISIDGVTQETYEQYRKQGTLDKVLEGAKNLVEAKKELGSKTPYIVFQMLVVKPNEHEIDTVKKLGLEIGVDEVKLKTAQIYDYEHGSDLIPTNPKYARYAPQENGTWKIKNTLLNQCWKLWHSCVFTWDGDVVPCCFDKDATYKMGNIHTTSFSTIWQGEKYSAFRKKLLRSRKEIDICTNCTEGTKVWA